MLILKLWPICCMFGWFTGITDSEIQFSSVSVVSGQLETKTALLLGSEIFVFVFPHSDKWCEMQWGVSNGFCFPKDLI